MSRQHTLVHDETIIDDNTSSNVNDTCIKDETIKVDPSSYNVIETHSGAEHHKVHPNGEQHHHKHRHHRRGSHHQKRKHYRHSAKQTNTICLTDSSSESREIGDVNIGISSWESQMQATEKSSCDHSLSCPSPIDTLLDDTSIVLPWCFKSSQITAVENHDMINQSKSQLYPSPYGGKKRPSIVGNDRKEEKMKTLEKYINRCHVNYEDIESKVTSTFSTLSFVLNHRRKVLLDEAKSRRDNKLRILNELREEMIDQQKGSFSNIISMDNQSKLSDTEAPSMLDNSEESEICNSIYEPWHGNTYPATGTDNENGFDDDQAINGSSPLTENQNDHHDESFHSQSLQEGNMTFSYEEEIVHLISKVGNIDENLSSPQKSTIEDMKDCFGVTGFKAEFKLVTRDMASNINYNELDIIDVRVYDNNKNKVHVTQSPSLIKEGTYLYSFVPVEPGKYEVVVALNDIEVSQSPYTFTAYQKLDLTIMNSKQMSESMNDIDFSDSSNENEDFKPATNQRGGIIQKGGESSILHSPSKKPTQIYANEEVQADCGWQVRVTTACTKMDLTIGVKTNSGITDLDEEITCKFSMGTPRGRSSSTRGSLRRQETSFTRVSWTFSVVLMDNTLFVKCHEKDEEKTVEIYRKEVFPLHPFCCMFHHPDSTMLHTCPRSQFAFL